jgi:hypothetical protein
MFSYSDEFGTSATAPLSQVRTPIGTAAKQTPNIGVPHAFQPWKNILGNSATRFQEIAIRLIFVV